MDSGSPAVIGDPDLSAVPVAMDDEDQMDGLTVPATTVAVDCRYT